MQFSKPRFISLLLAALWAACSLHCVADRALAHEHFQARGYAPLHHHPQGESHDHGDPLGHPQNSEDVDTTLCCELSARPSSPNFPERTLEPLLKSVVADNAYPEFARQSSLSLFWRPAPEPILAFLATDLSANLRALRAPNAPPA